MDQDSKLRLEEAKWFASELGKFKKAEDQRTVLKAETIEQVKPIYGANSEKLLKARESWSIENSLGNHIEIPSPRAENVQNLNQVKSEAVMSPAKATMGVAALGSVFAFDRIRNREYYSFKKERDKYVKEQVGKWQERKDESFAKSEEGARNRAINEFHDRKLAENPEKFQKWTKKHRDPDMERAIKRKEILDKENPRRNQKELEKYLKENDIKYPEKTHPDKGDISREEAAKRLERVTQKAEQIETPESVVEKLKLQKDKTGGGIATPDQRLEKATQIGMTKASTPAAAAAYLENIGNKPNQPDMSTEEATTAEKMERIEEVVEGLRRKEDEERRGSPAVPQHTKPIPQAPAQGSSFSSGSSFRPPRIYRRAQRARRRYGPGGVSKGVGKKVAKKSAMAAGRAVATNPYVLAAIGIAIAIIVGFLLLIAVIKYACDLYDDPIDVLASFASDPAGTTSMLVLAYIGRSVGLCEAPYQIQVPPNPPGVTTEKTGPSVVENGQNITYAIKVTYDSSAPNAISFEEFNSMSLYDVPKFPQTFVSATGSYDNTQTGSDGAPYIEWKMSDNITNSTSLEFTYEITPLSQDIRAINVIYVASEYSPVTIAQDSNPDAGATTPIDCNPRDANDIMCGANNLPTDDTCNGKWTTQLDEISNFLFRVDDRNPKTSPNPYTKMPGTGYNYADPVCSYSPAKWEKVLRQELGTSASDKLVQFWKDIADCEGGILSIGEKDIRRVTYSDGVTYNFPFGPYGHLQTNRGRPPIAKMPGRDEPLRGDVTWQQQIINAVNLRKEQGDFNFWGTARCICNDPYYSNYGPTCAGIEYRDPNGPLCNSCTRSKGTDPNR